MDELYRYAYWVFGLAAAANVLRILPDALQGAIDGSMYSTAAVAVLFAALAVEYRTRWTRVSVPENVRRVLLAVSVGAVLVIVYFFVA